MSKDMNVLSYLDYPKLRNYDASKITRYISTKSHHSILVLSFYKKQN